MIRNAYATGLKVWVPNADIEPSPKRYFYGAGTGHMALDEDGRFVLVDAGRRVYMSQVAKTHEPSNDSKRSPCGLAPHPPFSFFFQ